MLAGYRYGHKWVCDRTEGRHFAVIAMHFGACKGGVGDDAVSVSVPEVRSEDAVVSSEVGVWSWVQL